MPKSSSNIARQTATDIERAGSGEPASSANALSSQPNLHAITQRYAWLEAMINHVPDYIYAKDRDGRFIFANTAVVEINGFDSLDTMLGLSDADIHGADLSREIGEVERQVMETGNADLGFEEPAMRGGPDRWLMMSRVPLRDDYGQIIGVVGASRDISDQKASERMTRAQTLILERILEKTPTSLLMSELQPILQSLSKSIDVAVYRAVGNGTAFAVDKRSNSFWADPENELPTTSNEQLLSAFEQAAGDGETFVAQIRSADDRFHGAIAIRRGRHRWDAAILEFCRGIARLVGLSIDREMAEQEVQRLANTDHLTGLPNRVALDRRLAEMMSDGYPSREFSLGFIDLDNFKLINDSLGHGAGDALLKAIAQRLIIAVGAGGYVARLGGDEFVVVNSGCLDFKAHMQDLCRELGRPIRIGGTDFHVTCSVGFARYPQDGTRADELFAKADMAMYRAKEAGRNGIKAFSQDMAESVRQKLQRSEELRRAIVADQFILHYQPQYDISSAKITGAEALVRWHHPEYGLLAPLEFIPLAEETGLIVELGDLILKKAVSQARQWQDQGFVPFRMGVNLSARQFEASDLVPKVAAFLAQANLDPRWLEVEITESTIMRDNDNSISQMRELASLGISVALDDFGTGYSSLSNLKRFPISRIKIDRAFITDLPSDTDSAAITSAIISMSRQLGLQTIGEGVENEAQAAFLAAAGCNEAQGFLYGKPVPAEAFTAHLR